MPTWEQFQQRRRGRPAGSSKYRTFIRDLKPGEVGEWTIEEGRSAESVRSTFWWAAVQEGVKIETTVQGDKIWIARPPDEPPPKARRERKNPG